MPALLTAYGGVSLPIHLEGLLNLMKSKYSIFPPTALLVISSIPLIILLMDDIVPIAFPDYYYVIMSNLGLIVSAISRSLVSKKIKITSTFFLHYRYSSFVVGSNLLFLYLIFTGETPIKENNNSDMWGFGFMYILSMLNLYYIDFIAQHIPESQDDEVIEQQSENVAAVIEIIKPLIISIVLTIVNSAF